MKISDFWGDLSDISAKKEPLLTDPYVQGQPKEIACVNIDAVEVKEGAVSPAVTVHLHLNLHGIVECTKAVKQHLEESTDVPVDAAAPAGNLSSSCAMNTNRIL